VGWRARSQFSVARDSEGASFDVDGEYAAVPAHDPDDSPAKIVGTRTDELNMNTVVLTAPAVDQPIIWMIAEQRAQKTHVARIGDIRRIGG
jgi:hypothetical protein